METILIYLLRVSIAFAVLYLFFKVFLSKNTFHALNRVVAVLITVCALVVPAFHLPVPSTHWAAVELMNLQPADNHLVNQPTLVQPLSGKDVSTPVATHRNTTEYASAESTYTPMQTLWMLYLGGCFITFVLLVLNYVRLYRNISQSRKERLTDEGVVVCISSVGSSAFNWMHYIVLPSDIHADDKHYILMHELAHYRLRHSYDVLYFHLFALLFWFHPATWLLLSDLRTIHEFQADEKALTATPDNRLYKQLLIRKCVGEHKFALANHLAQHNLKKRIGMMLRAKTPLHYRWVYSILPGAFLIAGMLVACTHKQTVESANGTTILVDSVLKGNEALKDTLQKYQYNGIVVDTENNPVQSAQILVKEHRSVTTMNEDGTFSFEAGVALKLKLVANDGSKWQCYFVVNNPAHCRNLKIRLEGTFDKADWKGVRIANVSDAEMAATKKLAMANAPGIDRKTGMSYFYRVYAGVNETNNYFVDDKRVSKAALIKTDPKEFHRISWSAPFTKDYAIRFETYDGMLTLPIFVNDKRAAMTKQQLIQLFQDDKLKVSEYKLKKGSEVLRKYGDAYNTGAILIYTSTRKTKNEKV